MKSETAKPRGIAVVDVGFTNTKVILFSPDLQIVAERKTASPHHTGVHYREINVAPIIEFAAAAIAELDGLMPIDTIVPCAHGACIIALDKDGQLAVPAMDYTSEPPPDIVADYRAVMPSFAETYSPLLPMALMHGLQLFWQQRALPDDFARTATILPLMQYVGFALGGRTATEISSMSCQSHLVDMTSGGPSGLARAMGWAEKFAAPAKAWDTIGVLKTEYRGAGFRGQGKILAGVHDSNANYLRYLASGQKHFTLLSTGTWIIGFDTDARIAALDYTRDIVANASVFAKTVACCRFFGGREFEVVSGGSAGDAATVAGVARLVAEGVMALPSFTDSGGPVPGTGNKGRIVGRSALSHEERASLASLYCALMVSESLDAIHSTHSVIVDGPFSQSAVFLSVLAALRPHQPVLASSLRDGTAAGAACLALMPDGNLPRIDIAMGRIAPSAVVGLHSYHTRWRSRAFAI